MKTYRYTPAWRAAHGPIEVVQRPTAEWFGKLVPDNDVLMFRFALTKDGELYFGDGFTVLHRDIMQLRGPSNEEPLLIGAVRKIGEYWYVFTAQYWCAPKNEVSLAKRLLPRLPEWQDAVFALGNDPFLTAPGGWSRMQEDG